MHPLEDILAERIVVLDGAYGSALQGYNLAEEDYRDARFADHETALKGNHDLLCLTRPDVVSEVHNSYLAAGRTKTLFAVNQSVVQ